MVFNSFDFIVFLVAVFSLFWTIPHRFKWILLLLASYIFYMYWNPVYGLLLFLTSFIDFILSLYLTSSDNPKRRKAGLYLNILMSLSVLFFFKYFDFFLEISSQFLALIHVEYDPPKYNFLLPIGISFYTFQSLGYAIDVYRKDIKPEKNFGMFALYISFFPHLVAGPIQRAKDLLPQLKKERFFLTYENFRIGLVYCIWGFFMKIVVADNIAMIVDSVYKDVYAHQGGELLYATILFSFQIYTDFAGYSFIALGVAKFFDIDLMVNFKSPYLTQSLSGFWRSWHISLSVWVRDYIYIPLGGNRKGKFRSNVNLIVVFLVIGLWHGASYNFILWGAMHGAIIVVERLTGYNKDSVNLILRYFRYAINFLVITLTMIPVRAVSIDDTKLILERILKLVPWDVYFYFADNRYHPALISVTFMVIMELIMNRKSLEDTLKVHRAIRYPLYAILIFMMIMLGKSDGAPFIYFNF